MARRVVVFVDGMFMRRRVLDRNHFLYKPREIREYCMQHLSRNDYLFRIYYYDAQPLQARATSPLNGREIDFAQLESARLRQQLFEQLRTTPNFCLRLGNMEWNGRDWSIIGSKVAPLLRQEITVDDLTDTDIRPHAETAQINVKMALDLVTLAAKGIGELFVVITDKSDLAPALEQVKQEGVQICLDNMHAPVSDELAEQVDFQSTQLPG